MDKRVRGQHAAAVEGEASSTQAAARPPSLTRGEGCCSG
jgi:hypothetical protein